MLLTNEMRENVETIRDNDDGKESRSELIDESSSASLERRRRRVRSVRRRHVEMVGDYEEETKKEIDDDTSNVTIEGDEMAMHLGIHPANVDGGESKSGIDNEFSSVSIDAKKREEKSITMQSQSANAQDETDDVDDLETGHTSDILSEHIITNMEDVIDYQGERSKAGIRVESKEDNKLERKRSAYKPIMIAAMAPTVLVAIGSLAWVGIEVAKRFL